jgi:hypothetical protein
VADPTPIETIVGYLDAFPRGQGPAGLVEAFSRVPDPRDPRGVRHKVGTVLVVLVSAALAGARSVLAAWDWAAAHADEFAADGLAVPSYDCLRRTAARIDADELDKAVGAWALSLVAAGSGDGTLVVAADGKELRGAKNGGGQLTRLLAACDHATGAVLGQVEVGAKTNEIPKAKDLLDQIGDVDGMVFTLDALLGPSRTKSTGCGT